MYVEIVLTIIAITGLVLCYWQELESFYRNVRAKSSLAIEGVDNSQVYDLYYVPEGINNIIRRLIKITIGIDTKYTQLIFYIITILIILIVAVITHNRLSFIIRGILILTFCLIPLITLLARLQNLRVKSSKEGKTLVIELLDNYKIHYYNMQHAIEITASTIEEAPNCKRLLFNLSKGLNRASNNEEIRGLLADFKYAIGTSWAGILADNIFFSVSSGIRVDVALDDLINSIAMAEEVEECAKRENNEAGLILKYLVPVCYLLTYVGAIKIFGLTTEEFIYYQLGTQTGINWFASVIVIYVISLIVKFFLTNNKLDL